MESLQHTLDRVRPPRVQITYDVEIGNAIEMKELPFVMGIMADLSGKPENPLPKLKERKFVEIDRDNFNDIMASIAPRIAIRVKNTLANDDSETGIVLIFKNIDDFDPLSIALQVPALADIYQQRVKLKDLLVKLDGNDPLDDLLKQVMLDEKVRGDLKQQLDALAPAPAQS